MRICNGTGKAFAKLPIDNWVKKTPVVLMYLSKIW
jgi:hypothetical protein